MGSDARDKILDDMIKRAEIRVRQSVSNTASRLREVADELDRAANREAVEALPERVAHVVAWGVANARLDMPASALRDLQALRDDARSNPDAE